MIHYVKYIYYLNYYNISIYQDWCWSLKPHIPKPPKEETPSNSAFTSPVKGGAIKRKFEF